VQDGQLTLGHAKILAGVTDVVQQMELAKRVLTQDLSVRNLERIIQEPVAAPPVRQETTSAEPSAHIRDLEKSLTSQLGMRVQVRSASKRGKGRLVIHYGSLDQFDALLERLGVKAD
jgi:ParB family chromosome partitioning protein